MKEFIVRNIMFDRIDITNELNSKIDSDIEDNISVVKFKKFKNILFKNEPI